MTKETIRTVLLQEISAEIAIPPADIDDQASFMRLGVSSVQALKIISRLRKQLDLRFSSSQGAQGAQGAQATPVRGS